MKTQIKIYQMFQQGNIGAHQIVAIDEQPAEGFSNMNEAVHHLESLFQIGDYPFDNRGKFTFTILVTYKNS